MSFIINNFVSRLETYLIPRYQQRTITIIQFPNKYTYTSPYIFKISLNSKVVIIINRSIVSQKYYDTGARVAGSFHVPSAPTKLSKIIFRSSNELMNYHVYD